ncbi:MAG TPA: prepilin-type N-terminal cleavage/methylation domain-containing protein [Planctomycetota bacterium]|nr:prepilin-type N-terminal cleavage/methylation domain-containing protein [Planctomycetota bacterium]
MRPRTREHGMTLIELLAVIGIILLVIALALPNFASLLRSQRWTAASTALQNALRRCRSYAINARYDHAIEIRTDDDNGVYFRLETESQALEALPELNAYYHDQCGCLFVRFPIDWIRIFEAGGGKILNKDQADYYVEEDVQFVYDGPRFDVDGWSWRVPHNVKDNLLVDDEIRLPHGITVDFDKSLRLINYDARPRGVLDRPQYGWDDTEDLRFNLAGVLVQTQNPEIVLKDAQDETMTLQVLRSASRVRRLSAPSQR